MSIRCSFGGNWDGYFASIAEAEAAITDDMMAGMGEAVERLRKIEAEYPDQPAYHLMGPLPGGFYSEKQRRFFFAALHSGAITVPYSRTGQLGAEWQTRVEAFGIGRVVGHVWNTSPIAQLVMGEGAQARMFAGVWEVAQARYRGAAGELIGILRERAEKIMSTYYR